ncbi:MAG TPA: hypothetical protein VLW65_12950 [Bryobacteraceae bacterium]|nr:hypothetical protein [Bryobacteraceae bacterium]
MSPHQTFTRIPLQVGSELRIRNNGELRVSNPTLEIMSDDQGNALTPEAAADAALDYRFDPETGEHVLRLLEPVRLRSPRPSRKR